jgi:hypothetical protein
LARITNATYLSVTTITSVQMNSDSRPRTLAWVTSTLVSSPNAACSA